MYSAPLGKNKPHSKHLENRILDLCEFFRFGRVFVRKCFLVN